MEDEFACAIEKLGTYVVECDLPIARHKLQVRVAQVNALLGCCRVASTALSKKHALADCIVSFRHHGLICGTFALFTLRVLHR